MQNRIKRSERMFRTAMVGAPQGMAIANAQDLITDVNPALEDILGADYFARSAEIVGWAAEALGRPAEQARPGLLAVERARPLPASTSRRLDA